MAEPELPGSAETAPAGEGQAPLPAVSGAGLRERAEGAKPGRGSLSRAGGRPAGGDGTGRDAPTAGRAPVPPPLLPLAKAGASRGRAAGTVRPASGQFVQDIAIMVTGFDYGCVGKKFVFTVYM